MNGFGSRGSSSDNDGPKEIKNGTVTSVRGSPQKGKMRLSVRDKSSRGQAYVIDIPMKHASKVERKETYSFEVQEETEDRYGRPIARKKVGLQTYSCDEAPEIYSGNGTKEAFKSFDNTSNISGGRTKF